MDQTRVCHFFCVVLAAGSRVERVDGSGCLKGRGERGSEGKSGNGGVGPGRDEERLGGRVLVDWAWSSVIIMSSASASAGSRG